MKRYVLPSDLVSLTVGEGLAAGEIALLRPGSRERPRVVGAEVAELLEQFRSPTTVADAVLQHCTAHGGDPMATLDAAFPVLVALSRAELLTQEGGAAVEPVTARLAAGQQCGPAVLEVPVRVLRDSEVWRAMADGRPVAVKLARDLRLIAGEAAALRALPPGLAPELLHHDEDAGLLVLSWLDGDQVDVEAQRLAATGGSVRGLLLAVAGAYADLHEAGVLHGDVHPGNTRVHHGRVRLLDLGLAQLVGAAPAPRAVGGEYVEPEAAAAVLAADPLPPATEAGEQHAVAALLWRLLTCGPFLDLEPDRDGALQQIASQAPEPVGVWPAAEAVLLRALSKDPTSRFPSVRALAEALAAAEPPEPRPVLDLSPYEVGAGLWTRATGEAVRWVLRALTAAAERSGDAEATDLARVWALHPAR